MSRYQSFDILKTGDLFSKDNTPPGVTLRTLDNDREKKPTENTVLIELTYGVPKVMCQQRTTYLGNYISKSNSINDENYDIVLYPFSAPVVKISVIFVRIICQRMVAKQRRISETQNV